MEEYVVVGRIGKAHGLKGEVSVEPRTDEPERRFALGAVLRTESDRPRNPGTAAGPETLTVLTTRWHQGRLLIRFEEIPDRDAAEASRGMRLVVPVDPDDSPADPDEFYDHQLIGLRVVTTDGAEVGELRQVVHGAAQDLLVIAAQDREVLVPFVSALVPTVDVAGGRIVVADRPGLLSEIDPG